MSSGPGALHSILTYQVQHLDLEFGSRRAPQYPDLEFGSRCHPLHPALSIWSSGPGMAHCIWSWQRRRWRGIGGEGGGGGGGGEGGAPLLSSRDLHLAGGERLNTAGSFPVIRISECISCTNCMRWRLLQGLRWKFVCCRMKDEGIASDSCASFGLAAREAGSHTNFK